jgi:hypothetical protein
VARDAEAWETILAICAPGTFERLTVAERDGRPVAWMRTQHKPEDERSYLAAAAVHPDEPPATTAALVDHARGEVPDLLVVVFDEPGTAFGRHLAALAGGVVAPGLPEVPPGAADPQVAQLSGPGLGPFARHDHGIYVRVPDPVALLETLRPVLSARFAASPYAGRDGELVISLYERGVALDLADGAVAAVRAVPGVEDPFDDGGVGVAPDWFGALVLGRFGASGLEARADDVTLGRKRGLMDALFPPVATDVVGDF